ncbi:biotin--[acetyl-CoA-carboxylase] ligase [Zongyangia hominis]|uniref:Bifunctional ligase/repressor BirA n=1 Tax=Zongyangia hominis TaxID=2763677 RepID=A0A926EBF6_9FIRM|nr:biotin--[acetyl-CoA-carboxylase] ligase [Zongyangia hominis]MBC8569269.1 biotin--[acetyl-CoA-carboxylase] ligase [Zongyangia hominis]
MRRQRLLEILDEAGGGYVSGEELASRMGVTRAAVWKGIKQLREEGYDIRSKTNSGYALGRDLDLITPQKIAAQCAHGAPAQRIVVEECVTSTNTLLRQLAMEGAPEGTVLVAQEQSEGRGRMGRAFLSPRGGVYLSILLRPPMDAEHLLFLTMIAALSVTDAIRGLYGVELSIKWVNDILYDRRKLSGILTEASLDGESGSLEFAVVGIGLNCGESVFPPEIASRAASLREVTDKPISRCALCAALLDAFWPRYDAFLAQMDTAALLSDYRQRLCMLGERVEVLSARETYEGVALDVDANGALLVKRDDGSVAALRSGEISIRTPAGT